MPGPARRDEASRTVSFFALVAHHTGTGAVQRLEAQPWQRFLSTLAGRSLPQRTVETPTRRLIGEVFVAEEDYALKLMEPRDENSWLEILRRDRAAEPLDPTRIGQLVETSIVAFLPFKNIFGMIRGSTSSPTHTAVAEWLDHLDLDGRRLVSSPNYVMRAEPALSQTQRQKLRAASGVTSASVRISTSRAERLEQAGSTILADAMKSLRRTYGDMIVTITMRVPRGRDHEDARDLLKREAERLAAVSDAAEAVSATLVTYDDDERTRQEEIQFVSQRIAMKTLVPVTGEDGRPIRNASAVRAILAAARELAVDLDSA